MKSTWFGLLILTFAAAPAASWDIPPDNGTLGRDAIQAILAGNDYPVTGSYHTDSGVHRLLCPRAGFHTGRRHAAPGPAAAAERKELVIVGAEPGSEYGMDFVSTVEGLEGPGVWLARRGVTFVALTRVGRWNFLAPTRWFVGKRPDRTADADVQPGAEDALAARRLRGEALGRVGQYLGRRERDLSLSEEGHRSGTPDARRHAARVHRGIPSRAGESDSRPPRCPRAVLGHVHRRRQPLSAREVRTLRTVILAGARARPGSRMSTAGRSTATSTTCSSAAR